jgi:hypothetical protein
MCRYLSSYTRKGGGGCGCVRSLVHGGTWCCKELCWQRSCLPPVPGGRATSPDRPEGEVNEQWTTVCCQPSGILRSVLRRLEIWLAPPPNNETSSPSTALPRGRCLVSSGGVLWRWDQRRKLNGGLVQEAASALVLIHVLIRRCLQVAERRRCLRVPRRQPYADAESE